MKRKDFLLIFIILLLAVIFFGIRGMLYRGNGSIVIVQVDGRLYGKYPLYEDADIVIEQEDGKNILRIQDGKVFMEEADCPNRDCVKIGKIQRMEQTIVCLPHRLVVEIRQEP